MDKELLRIVIIASGLLVITGMVVWAYLKNKRSSDSAKLFSGDRKLGNISESLKLHPEHDEYDIVPVQRGKSRQQSQEFEEQELPDKPVPKTSAQVVNLAPNVTPPPKPEPKPAPKPSPLPPTPVVAHDDEADFDFDFDDYEPIDYEKTRITLPPIIQFSIVANADVGFNGLHLLEAFETVGLRYGTMKIFERIDSKRNVLFGVACMVEPGTFPTTNMETFYCPGIVFFMQHAHLENAQAVFDDYIETIEFLAGELDGVVWDHQRQPLTEDTVEAMRRCL